MKPWILVGQTAAPDGTPLALQSRDGEFLLLAGGKPLMSSQMHASEDALATLACRRLKALPAPHVLIGGLGMGFTLRAALDLLPPAATVVVAELVPAVVSWNQGPLGPLAGHPLNDPRVRVEETDVAIAVRSNRGVFDAVLLDVDNGSDALTTSTNGWLYSDRGVDAHSLFADCQRRPRDVAGVRGSGDSHAACASTASRSISNTCEDDSSAAGRTTRSSSPTSQSFDSPSGTAPTRARRCSSR